MSYANLQATERVESGNTFAIEITFYRSKKKVYVRCGGLCIEYYAKSLNLSTFLALHVSPFFHKINDTFHVSHRVE